MLWSCNRKGLLLCGRRGAACSRRAAQQDEVIATFGTMEILDLADKQKHGHWPRSQCDGSSPGKAKKHLVVTGSRKAAICSEWQYVMLLRYQIELKVKLSYKNTAQMARRNEKIRRGWGPFHSMSAETPTVSVFLWALSEHLPSTSNIPVNTCLYLASASAQVNTARFLFACAQTRPPLAKPLDSYFSCSHASRLPSRWRACGDETPTLWRGETHCKDETLRREVCGFWQTKVTFIQVVPDALSKQRPRVERHWDGGKNNATVCSYLSL